MGESIWNGIWRDTRLSLRKLRTAPAFALGALLTLALAIGANASVYGIVHAVLLAQLPYEAPERLLWIWSSQPERDRSPFSVPDFIDYRDGNQSLQGFAGFFAFGANINDASETVRVQGVKATGNLTQVLGAEIALGRGLDESDGVAGATAVALLTDGFWQRRFGGDPKALGQTMLLDGVPHTVVGVLAPRFVLPVRDLELVVPWSPDADPRRSARNSLNFIQAVGRLREGVSTAQVQDDLQRIATRLREQYPVENARKMGVTLVGAAEGISGAFRPGLMILLGAVALVLLIACVNLAGLMLTDISSRRREIALRLALGSSRARLARQALVDAFVIALIGGAIGLGLAYWGIALASALAPKEMPRLDEAGIDWSVALFSLLIAIAAGVVCGLAPAIAAARGELREPLLDGGRATTSARTQGRGLLVAGQVALAFLLLILAGLSWKSFVNTQSVDPGFDATDTLSMRLALPPAQFPDGTSIDTFQRELNRRVAEIPGVQSSAAVSILPLADLRMRVPFTVQGQAIERENIPRAQYRLATPALFDALRIPVQRGRAFSEGDVASTRPVAVVSAALVRDWLPAGDPIGQRLLVDDNDTAPREVEIVGVVGDVRQVALETDPGWDLYLPYAQLHPDVLRLATANMFWVMRGESDPARWARPAVAAVRAVNPDVAAAQVRPLDEYLEGALAGRRFSLTLAAMFGIAALLLAVTGLYAITAHGIAQRRHEIAIRVALGASGRDILTTVVRQAMRFVVLGLLVGAVIALAGGRVLATLLFGVDGRDPSTLVASSALIMLVTLVACAIPGMRATRVAGFEALR